MFERWEFISDSLLVWLVTTSIQISIVGLVIAIIDRVVEHRVWPQVRAAMWWLLVVGLAISPFVKSPVSVWQRNGAISKVSETIVRDGSAENSLQSAINGEPKSLPHVNPAISRKAFAKWVVLATWLCGAVMCAAIVAWRTVQIHRRWIGSRVEMPAWFIDLLVSAADKIGLKRLPCVVVSDAAPGPAVIGAIRSTVVLPVSIIDNTDREQLEHVLLHEFAHVRRLDALASRFCQFVQIIFWFHPMVRLARKQLDTLREICCDETVARAMRGDAESYRRTLLNMARTLLDSPAPAAIGFVHPHSQIMARLTHLERPLTSHPRTVRGAAAVLFALLLVYCIPQVQSLAPRLEPMVANLADLPGCMQLRFTVMRALAQEEARQSGA